LPRRRSRSPSRRSQARSGGTPRSWVEASYRNVIYFHEVAKGGHLVGWEEPELFSNDIRAAFSSLR
jgi:hypothetical protein